MNEKEKREYYIVDKRILPNSIQSVIKVNDLVQHSKISKYEAIKKVGISRSTYYKYKDFIKPFFESGKDKVFSIHMSLVDKPGILAKVLEIIATEDMNILTIIQNIAIDGIGNPTVPEFKNKSKLLFEFNKALKEYYCQQEIVFSGSKLEGIWDTYDNSHFDVTRKK